MASSLFQLANTRFMDSLLSAAVLCGVASNNVAEYTGLIEGLDISRELSPNADVHVRMDSKLVVEQMSGRWKIKHPDMQALAAAARKAMGTRRVVFEWVPRDNNARADQAANEALDKGQSYRSL